MATANLNKPLIVIVGPTASGKTALAIELARRFNGEIICADSRTIYKGMDIGTAKPTKIEQELVVHHGLDLINPGESYSAADFKRYALKKIDEIRSRGRVPFLVGGTGLYIDSIIFDYDFGTKSDYDLREKLDKLSIEELHKIYNEMNISIPENKLNKRYLVRGIERSGDTLKRRNAVIDNTVVVGISTEKDILRDRIFNRAEKIFEEGVIDEAKTLADKYSWDSEAMTGNIYKIIRKYLAGELTEAEMKQKNATSDWRLAKRQLTWFKRNQFIQWGSASEVKSIIISVLDNIL